MQGRITTADLLKGIAVVLMIQVHLTELFAVPDLYEGVAGRLSLFMGGPPAAPLFMIVMGFFIAYRAKSPSRLFLRGIRLFLGGILLNIALNFNLLLSLMSGRFEYSIDPYRYVLGADILPLAGMSMIVFSLLTRLVKVHYLFYFFLAAAVFLVKPFLPLFGSPDSPVLMYINAFLWGNFEWSYFPLVPWIAYPLTGAGFYHLHFRYPTLVSGRIRIPLLLLWGVFLAATISYGIEIAANLEIYYHHDVNYFLWILMFLSGSALAAGLLETKYASSKVIIYLRWLGRNVTAAYVFQWIIIGNIATEVYRTVEAADLFFWFAAILSAVSGLVYVTEKYVLNRVKNYRAARLV